MTKHFFFHSGGCCTKECLWLRGLFWQLAYWICESSFKTGIKLFNRRKRKFLKCICFFFRGFSFDCVNRSLHELKFSDGERWFIMIIFIIINRSSLPPPNHSHHIIMIIVTSEHDLRAGESTHRWQRSAACQLSYQIFQKASLSSAGFVIFES